MFEERQEVDVEKMSNSNHQKAILQSEIIQEKRVVEGKSCFKKYIGIGELYWFLKRIK